MRAVSANHHAIVFAGALLLALAAGGFALRQGAALPTLAATSAASTPCLVDRDVPYYGGAAPAIARPATSPPAPPPAPNPAIPAPPGDRHIPPRPPLTEPCRLRLLDERAAP